MLTEDYRPPWKVLVIGGRCCCWENHCGQRPSRAIRRFRSPHRCDLATPSRPLPTLRPTQNCTTSTRPEKEIFGLTPEYLCERHIRSAQAISATLDPVVEYLSWEWSPVILEGAWITPAVAARWTNQYEALRTVFYLRTGCVRSLGGHARAVGNAKSHASQKSDLEGLLALRQLGTRTGLDRRATGG